ncbi:MAG: enolase C-terminal domain-like protein [Eubacteriales bacterium]
MNNILIRDIKVFVTAPSGINLVVVKVETTEPELYGYGCATFTWRCKAVVTAIEEYLKPAMIGRNVENIEDLWQVMMNSSYWRNGPILNNAISGIDEALWDIKGKMANMPIYNLLGGKCREGIAAYAHADGDCIEAVLEKVQQLNEEGYQHIRCQMGTYGGNFNGKNQEICKPEGAYEGSYYNPKTYMQGVIALFDKLRNIVGWDVEFLHDVHERLSLINTLQFAKELEQFKLFFLEDSLSPDQVGYFEKLRAQTAVPLAMGELFTHPLEWKTIVQNQWIDYIRVHLSDIGGLTSARKLAHFCEAYGVKTAWHGPGDLSPFGAMIQLHLDYASPNFGIQEYTPFSKQEREVFLGCPEWRKGYIYIDNPKPGIGIEFNEKEAAKYPFIDMDHSWLYPRLPDGTAVCP